MSDQYLLVLPFPPSVNNYYGHTCIGAAYKKVVKIFIKERGRTYREEVKKIVRDQNLNIMANVPLSVSIEITPPDNRVHDIDNILKCLFDSISHSGFWEDDLWVRKLSMCYAEKETYKKPGSLLVHVEAL